MSFQRVKTAGDFNKNILPFLRNPANVLKTLEYIAQSPHVVSVMFILADAWYYHDNFVPKEPSAQREVICTVANARVDTYERRQLPKGKLLLKYKISAGRDEVIKEKIMKSATPMSALSHVISCASYMDDATMINVIIEANGNENRFEWVVNKQHIWEYTNDANVLNIERIMLSEHESFTNNALSPTKKTAVKNDIDCTSLTLVELRKLASTRKVTGRSKMNKEQLVSSIRYKTSNS
jgi:hypothetical protein